MLVSYRPAYRTAYRNHVVVGGVRFLGPPVATAVNKRSPPTLLDQYSLQSLVHDGFRREEKGEAKG